MKNKINIIIFSFIEDTNIGDPVIGETCKYLVEKICGENKIDADINLKPLFPPPNWRTYRITRFLRRRSRKDRGSFGGFLTYLGFRFYNCVTSVLRDYYKSVLSNADMVIFAGGGMFKFVSQDFWASDYMIIDFCDKNKIPVYFNAVGIEGYDEKHFLSRLLKKIMNKKCIYKITTRDDVISLSKYLDKDCSDLLVGDPALYSDDLYSRKKQTEVVGINTIRSGIFNLNGKNIKEDDLIKFYCELIHRLNSKGYKWQLFTNGTDSDYDMALKVLKELDISPSNDNLAIQPKNSQELIDLITSYKGIIGSRMHAHIIATSYSIPTVGLIWNDKIRWFAKHTGCSDRFFEYYEMNEYDKIFNAFERALSEQFSKQNDIITNLKRNTYENLSDFIVKQNCGQGVNNVR